MERGGERDCGSWLWSQTAAIKSSSRGNASLKLRAHILVVGHMQLRLLPQLRSPSWWRETVQSSGGASFPQTGPIEVWVHVC